MATITVTISDTELKALEAVAVDSQEWANNAVQNRARKSIADICATLLQHCNENSISMAVGQDAQVTQAFDLGIAKKMENVDYTPE